MVQPNQGRTHAIRTWLSRAFCYCRGPRKHDDDTGDVARGQYWSTPCMHCVRKAEFLLLGPKGRVGAVETKAQHTQFALGSLGPFVTAEDLENMTTTPETSLEVNAGPHRACTACARPRFYSLARNATSVRSNQGKTRAIHTWFSWTFWYCRGPRKHDNDTGDVARGQCWSTSCMHCVCIAELL